MTRNIWLLHMISRSMYFPEIVFLAFALQGFFLSFVFMIKSTGDPYSNRLFGVFLMAFSYAILFNSLYWSDYWIHLRRYLGFSSEMVMASFGPIFFFYARRIVQGTKIRKKDWYHMIPLGYLSVNYFLFLFFRLFKLHQSNGLSTLFQVLRPINKLVIALTILLMVLYGIIVLLRYVNNYKHDWDMRIWLGISAGSFILLALSYTGYYAFNNSI